MPILLTASPTSEKRWGTLTNWPLHIDLATNLLAFILLPLAVAHSYLWAWDNSLIWDLDVIYRYNPQNVSLIVFVGAVGPVFAIILATCNTWLFTTRVLPPGSALGTSIFAFVVWFYFATQWAPPQADESTPLHLHASKMAIGVVLEIGAAIEIILNFIYLIVAAKAVHRLRKHRSAAPSEHELRSPPRGSPPASLVSSTMGGGGGGGSGRGEVVVGARVEPVETV